MYIISACLAGINCRYNGGNNESERVREIIDEKECVLVCPEEMGMLPTPRPPAEIINGKVIDKNGKDVTDNFIQGAEKALEIAEKKSVELGQKIELAILKANSPSCGCGKVYDGTFSGILTDGDGIFAALLKKKGIPVITEKEFSNDKQEDNS